MSKYKTKDLLKQIKATNKELDSFRPEITRLENKLQGLYNKLLKTSSPNEKLTTAEKADLPGPGDNIEVYGPNDIA